MPTEQILSTLTINKVDSEETFKKMKAAGMVNDDELYLTPEGVAGTEEQITVSETEPADAVENDLWLDLDEDAPASLSISGGTLTGPLAMSNNKITGVGNPTSAQDVATKNYIDTSFLALTGGVINGDLTIGNSDTNALKFGTANGAYTIKANSTGLLVSAVNIYMTAQGAPSPFTALITMRQAKNNFQPKIEVESASGAITKTLSDYYDYTFNNVSSLNLTAGTGSCHGFITFGSSKPTVSLSGFTKVDGDIANAAASTVWEFSCYNKYAVFKNWSEV